MPTSLGFAPTTQERFFFISYKRVDTERIAPITSALAQRGIPLWYDQDIRSGTEWEAVLAERIRKSQAVLLFVSRHIFERTDAGENYVQLEYKVARRNGKEIIPVFLDYLSADRIPAEYAFWYEELAGIQGINAADPHIGAATIIREIDARLEPVYYGTFTSAGYSGPSSSSYSQAAAPGTGDVRHTSYPGENNRSSRVSHAAPPVSRSHNGSRIVIAAAIIIVALLLVLLMAAVARRRSASQSTIPAEIPEGASTVIDDTSSTTQAISADTAADEVDTEDTADTSSTAAASDAAADENSADTSTAADNQDASADNGSTDNGSAQPDQTPSQPDAGDSASSENSTGNSSDNSSGDATGNSGAENSASGNSSSDNSGADNSAQGGDASGNNTQGGDASGGNAQGGDTSGNNASDNNAQGNNPSGSNTSDNDAGADGADNNSVADN